MKQLLILSGKGGSGKTTVASAFIKISECKVFADCDVDAPNLHLVMDFHNNIEENYYDLPKASINKDLCIECGECEKVCEFGAIKDLEIDSFACEGCSLCSEVCSVNAIDMSKSIGGKIYLYDDNERIFSTAKLKMGHGTSGKLVSSVKEKIKNKDADIAIIDGSPGIGCPVIASLSGVDMVLIVAEPSLSGISDMKRIVNTAKIFGVTCAICVNKYDLNMENTESIKRYCIENGLEFVGVIPFDKNAVKAINNNKTVVDFECKSGEAIKQIYSKVINII